MPVSRGFRGGVGGAAIIGILEKKFGHFFIGVTAYTRICRPLMKFCQTLTCIFDEVEILSVGQDLNKYCKQMQLPYLSGYKTGFLSL